MTKENQILELYRIYVSTIIAQEQRRYQIIAVYSTLMAGAWGLLVTDGGAQHQALIIAFICTISVIWTLTVCAFRRLAKAKFAIIDRIEADFPVQPFGWEWKYTKNNRFSNLRLSLLDTCIPLFAMACAIVYQVLSCI